MQGSHSTFALRWQITEYRVSTLAELRLLILDNLIIKLVQRTYSPLNHTLLIHHVQASRRGRSHRGDGVPRTLSSEPTIMCGPLSAAATVAST